MSITYQDHMERAVLGPLVRGINGVIGGTAAIALRWRCDDARLSSPHARQHFYVCIVDGVTGKTLSVYMNPDTLRKRLEFAARILGADLVAEASA